MAESPNGIANPAEQFQNSVMQNPEDQSSAKDAAPKNTNTGDAKCVEYTRKQLYEAVWSTPCQKLAASLGLARRWLLLAGVHAYFSGAVHTEIDLLLRRLNESMTIRQLTDKCVFISSLLF